MLGKVETLGLWSRLAWSGQDREESATIFSSRIPSEDIPSSTSNGLLTLAPDLSLTHHPDLKQAPEPNSKLTCDPGHRCTLPLAPD